MLPSKALITSEGYPFIAYCAGLFLFLASGSWLLSSAALAVPAVITCILLVFVISFFRNPERRPSADPRSVVAPADGTVVYAGPATQEHLGDCLKISIFMSVFNVHVNRAPLSGKILARFYRQGRFLNAKSDRASAENEQLGLLVETDNGTRFVVVQIAGLIARRILCYLEVGDHMERGLRYGMIRFGSRVDLFLPVGLQPMVQNGQTVVAGETVLAQLPDSGQGA